MRLKTKQDGARRRNLLKLILTGVSARILPGLAILAQPLTEKVYAAATPVPGVQSVRPSEAFAKDSLAPTFTALFGDCKIPVSEKVRVVAADLAENGAVVPVKVETDFDLARSITLLATKNPVPLVAQFNFSARVKPFVATRVKLAESSDIIAIVETADGFFQARRHVEVTIGGCSA